MSDTSVVVFLRIEKEQLTFWKQETGGFIKSKQTRCWKDLTPQVPELCFSPLAVLMMFERCCM